MHRKPANIIICHLAGVSAVLRALVRPARRQDRVVPEFSLQSSDAPPAFLVLAEFEDDENSWEEFDDFTEASDVFDAISGNDEDALRVRLRSRHAHFLDWARPGFPLNCEREGDPYLLLVEESDGTRMFEFHHDWKIAEDVVLEYQRKSARFIEVRRGGEPTLCWSPRSAPCPRS